MKMNNLKACFTSFESLNAMHTKRTFKMVIIESGNLPILLSLPFVPA